MSIAAEVIAKFREITVKTYKEQACFYLNAFWSQLAEGEAEAVWKTTQEFIAVDLPKGKNGNELNEVLAHHYLQKIGRTLTALELRAELRKIDIDANGEMALLEYLLFVYKRDVVECINNPQGGESNSQELNDAKARIEALNTAYDELQVQLEEQKKLEAAAKAAEIEARKVEAAAVEAEKEAKQKEAEARTAEELATQQDNAARAAADLAKAAADVATAAAARAAAQEASAKTAEAAATAADEAAASAAAAAKDAEEKVRAAEKVVRDAEEEAKAVNAALQAEKDAYNNEIARLDALTKDETVGIVKRNTAVQDLARLKGQDPLPLQKAKITQEAVVRKVEKARKAAEEETAKAATATAEAVSRADAAKQAREAATNARKKAVAEREQADADKVAADEAAAKAAAAAAKAADERQKAEAARAAAEEARKQAQKDRAAAEQARADAEAAAEAASTQRQMVEAHIADIQQKTIEAVAFLEELKKRAAIPHGSIWWMEREIIEKKKFLPKHLQ